MIRNSSGEVWAARGADGLVLVFPTALPPHLRDGEWHRQPDDSEEPFLAMDYPTWRAVFGQPLPVGSRVRMALQCAVMLPEDDGHA